jgi:phosphate starvation-inducible membrane PsiE
MKTTITFQVDDSLNDYLRYVAYQQRLTISEVIRQMIEDHKNNNDSIEVADKIKILDERISRLQEQQNQLSYQRDYLKDRIED